MPTVLALPWIAKRVLHVAHAVEDLVDAKMGMPEDMRSARLAPISSVPRSTRGCVESIQLSAEGVRALEMRKPRVPSMQLRPRQKV